MDAGAGKQLILTRFRHLTMEDNLRLDAEFPGVGAQVRPSEQESELFLVIVCQIGLTKISGMQRIL